MIIDKGRGAASGGGGNPYSLHPLNKSLFSVFEGGGCQVGKHYRASLNLNCIHLRHHEILRYMPAMWPVKVAE